MPEGTGRQTVPRQGAMGPTLRRRLPRRLRQLDHPIRPHPGQDSGRTDRRPRPAATPRSHRHHPGRPQSGRCRHTGRRSGEGNPRQYPATRDRLVRRANAANRQNPPGVPMESIASLTGTHRVDDRPRTTPHHRGCTEHRRTNRGTQPRTPRTRTRRAMDRPPAGLRRARPRQRLRGGAHDARLPRRDDHTRERRMAPHTVRSDTARRRRRRDPRRRRRERSFQTPHPRRVPENDRRNTTDRQRTAALRCQTLSGGNLRRNRSHRIRNAATHP